jgi:hypothetical protein
MGTRRGMGVVNGPMVQRGGVNKEGPCRRCTGSMNGNWLGLGAKRELQGQDEAGGQVLQMVMEALSGKYIM